MFYFLHLHKCAGSSFVDLAQSNGVKLFTPNGNGNPLNPLTGRRWAFWEWDEAEQRYLASSQHFGLIANERELGREHEFYEGVTYVVILRDPIERMLSHFEWRYRETLKGNRTTRDRAKAFTDYLQNHKSVWWAENYFVHAFTYSSGRNGAAARPAADLLGLAKQRLENFDHIFFVDRFDADVGAMHTYGWKPVERRLKSLTGGGPTRAGVREALLEFSDVWNKIRSRNEDDFDLYAHARTLADRRDRRQVPNRKFTVSRHERPESDRFEFLLYCAYEAHVLGESADSRMLLGEALQHAADDDLDGQSRETFVDTALARFAVPARAAVRPERQTARDQRVASKSAARAEKAQRKLEKKEKKEQRRAHKEAKAAKKARKAGGG
jgi:hypothetical protein